MKSAKKWSCGKFRTRGSSVVKTLRKKQRRRSHMKTIQREMQTIQLFEEEKIFWFIEVTSAKVKGRANLREKCGEKAINAEDDRSF